MENLNEIEAAKQLLKDNGYYTDNLWHVDDVKAKLGLLGLSEGLAKTIMSNMLDELIQTRNFVDEKIKSQKCFKHEGTFYPLNIKEILKN